MPSSGSHSDDYSRRHAPGPVYHLNTEHLNTLSPPSIVDTGTNSLDDILKTPSKPNIIFLSVDMIIMIKKMEAINNVTAI